MGAVRSRTVRGQDAAAGATGSERVDAYSTRLSPSRNGGSVRQETCEDFIAKEAAPIGQPQHTTFHLKQSRGPYIVQPCPKHRLEVCMEAAGERLQTQTFDQSQLHHGRLGHLQLARDRLVIYNGGRGQ